MAALVKYDDLYIKSVMFGKSLLSSVGDGSRISRIFLMFFVTHILLLFVLADFCFENCSQMNLGVFTEFAASSLTFVRETLYMLVLWRVKDKWNILFDDMILEKNAIDDSEQQTVIRVNYMKAEFRTTMWYLIPSFAMLIMISISVFFYPNKNLLPLAYNIVWLPYDDYSMNWAINYFYQTWNVAICSIVYYTYYPLTLILMNHSCWGVDMTLVHVQELKKTLELDECDLRRTSVDKHLKDIIERTYKVLKWKNRIQNALQFSFLIDFTLVSFIMCLCVYTLTSDDFESVSVITLPSTILLQLYVYCWIGNSVMTKLDILTEALYGINWYAMDGRQREDLQKIIAMAQNMKGFNGIFRTVSLSTFQKILEFTYTIYALLRNVK